MAIVESIDTEKQTIWLQSKGRRAAERRLKAFQFNQSMISSHAKKVLDKMTFPVRDFPMVSRLSYDAMIADGMEMFRQIIWEAAQ